MMAPWIVSALIFLLIIGESSALRIPTHRAVGVCENGLAPELIDATKLVPPQTIFGEDSAMGTRILPLVVRFVLFFQGASRLLGEVGLYALPKIRTLRKSEHQSLPVIQLSGLMHDCGELEQAVPVQLQSLGRLMLRQEHSDELEAGQQQVGEDHITQKQQEDNDNLHDLSSGSGEPTTSSRVLVHKRLLIIRVVDAKIVARNTSTSKSAESDDLFVEVFRANDRWNLEVHLQTFPLWSVRDRTALEAVYVKMSKILERHRYDAIALLDFGIFLPPTTSSTDEEDHIETSAPPQEFPPPASSRQRQSATATTRAAFAHFWRRLLRLSALFADKIVFREPVVYGHPTLWPQGQVDLLKDEALRLNGQNATGCVVLNTDLVSPNAANQTDTMPRIEHRSLFAVSQISALSEFRMVAGCDLNFEFGSRMRPMSKHFEIEPQWGPGKQGSPATGGPDIDERERKSTSPEHQSAFVRFLTDHHGSVLAGRVAEAFCNHSREDGPVMNFTENCDPDVLLAGLPWHMQQNELPQSPKRAKMLPEMKVNRDFYRVEDLGVFGHMQRLRAAEYRYGRCARDFGRWTRPHSTRRDFGRWNRPHSG